MDHFTTGVPRALWDHTVLPVIRHKWTHPALTPARQACLTKSQVPSPFHV